MIDNVRMWELDYKESWVLKNWCFWAVVLEKTLESPLDCKEIQPAHPKGNQFWVFIGRTDVEAETPILWPPDAKSWLICKDPDAGKDWGQEEKWTTKNEMVGWHHQLNGHEFGWTPGVGDGQGGLACCSSWGRKESDTTEHLNWTKPLEVIWKGTVGGKVKPDSGESWDDNQLPEAFQPAPQTVISIKEGIRGKMWGEKKKRQREGERGKSLSHAHHGSPSQSELPSRPTGGHPERPLEASEPGCTHTRRGGDARGLLASTFSFLTISSKSFWNISNSNSKFNMAGCRQCKEPCAQNFNVHFP